MNNAHGDFIEWPYPVDYDKESEISADVLVLGGGLAGSYAAISAARKGLEVILVDKGGIKRSGSAGSGADHWMNAPANPASRITPDEHAEAIINGNDNGWIFGIGTYIESKESWSCLLELEEMGMKIRDTEDEFKGADFRDEDTKLLFAYDYANRFDLRVWGTGMKPALYKECKRLGIEMHDRVTATGLLTEGGKQGTRVVGATGIHARTGEFFVFKAKSTVLCMSCPERLWMFSTETIGGYGSQYQPFTNAGEGFAMAWRAGAEFTKMEKSNPWYWPMPPYGEGNPHNTWYGCSMVDANGKELPWVDKDGTVLETVSARYRPAPEQRMMLLTGISLLDQELVQPRPAHERLMEFTPPFYADLPSMPELERRAIFGLMVGQEGKTNIPVYYTLTQAGFDPDQDMLQNYGAFMGEMGFHQWRMFAFFGHGGLITDWDLMTNVEGLFAAGEQLLTGKGIAHACATGRYAGGKAAEFARKAGAPVIDQEQVQRQKTRAYAPIRCKDGMDWKELEAGIAKVMQDYCGAVKNDEQLTLGLTWLHEMREAEASQLSARNPHELTRALEVLSLLDVGEMVIHASKARKASSMALVFMRSDYPQMDPPEWKKWITIKMVEGKVAVDELPLNFWGDLKENYEAHCEL